MRMPINDRGTSGQDRCVTWSEKTTFYSAQKPSLSRQLERNDIPATAVQLDELVLRFVVSGGK